VAQKLPNPWGLYDMYGNVNEWVQDWYDEKYYRISPKLDPQGPSSGHYRVVRGGGWLELPWGLRSASRQAISSNVSAEVLGVRLLRMP